MNVLEKYAANCGVKIREPFVASSYFPLKFFVGDFQSDLIKHIDSSSISILSESFRKLNPKVVTSFLVPGCPPSKKRFILPFDNTSKEEIIFAV